MWKFFFGELYRIKYMIICCLSSRESLEDNFKFILKGLFFQMFVSTLLCFLRDCMKGDETENKKIGCTVNLMVKVFPLSLCATVQSHWNWDGKGWDRNLCQASPGMAEENEEDCEDPLEASDPARCFMQGQRGQAPQGCVQLSSVSLWHRFYNFSHIFFQLLTAFIWKKNHATIKLVG